jgi:hypothetical protein
MNFSVSVTKHFKLASRPIIPLPQKQLSKLVVIRLLFERVTEQVICVPTDVVIEIGTTPGSRHMALSSMLIETQEGLELRL